MESKDSKNSLLTPFRVLAHTNGTKTLVDTENGQSMHSRIGPESEARWVYADAARIETSLRHGEDRHILYDVGMGTAANVLAVLERISENREAMGRLEIFSFENKPDGLAFALENLGDFPLLKKWETQLRELLMKGETRFELGRVSVQWTLCTGDFYSRLSEKTIPSPDTLFFDFYSPKVVPELWSRNNFEAIRAKIGNRAARLFTYSAATPVRLNLLLAGFFVGNGISTGVKSETTVAATELRLLESPLDARWLSKLETSASIANVPDKDQVRSHPQWNSDSSS